MGVIIDIEDALIADRLECTFGCMYPQLVVPSVPTGQERLIANARAIQDRQHLPSANCLYMKDRLHISWRHPSVNLLMPFPDETIRPLFSQTWARHTFFFHIYGFTLFQR